MKKICVITGVIGGLGLDTAKRTGEIYSLLISDINKERLDKAVAELQGMGIDVEGMAVNIAERGEVAALAQKAKSMGRVSAVIHPAALTPVFAAPEKIMRVNALGTIHVYEEFYMAMEAGSCILDICSDAPFLISPSTLPLDTFKLSRCNNDNDKKEFLSRMMEMVYAGDEKVYQGMAYSLSRAFIGWYVRNCCFTFGRKGIRVMSVVSDVIDTVMSEIVHRFREQSPAVRNFHLFVNECDALVNHRQTDAQFLADIGVCLRIGR
jgi:NAD(P)-dependent dehydrogenase (short-subunit alcohol dehydrogenase family)